MIAKVPETLEVPQAKLFDQDVRIPIQHTGKCKRGKSTKVRETVVQVPMITKVRETVEVPVPRGVPR